MIPQLRNPSSIRDFDSPRIPAATDVKIPEAPPVLVRSPPPQEVPETPKPVIVDESPIKLLREKLK